MESTPAHEMGQYDESFYSTIHSCQSPSCNLQFDNNGMRYASLSPCFLLSLLCLLKEEVVQQITMLVGSPIQCSEVQMAERIKRELSSRDELPALQLYCFCYANTALHLKLASSFEYAFKLQAQ